ncbi:MAG: hypothetical protein ACRD0P_03745 [Stackebrandtia sp.]
MTLHTPVVTTDPQLLERLEARIDELTSRDMAAYARSLGLTPPGDGDPPVVLHFPAGADLDGPGQIVWDMRPDEE